LRRRALYRDTETCRPVEESRMQDLLYIAITVVFFALSIAYVEFCDRLK
jgi:hypothetical protein